MTKNNNRNKCDFNKDINSFENFKNNLKVQERKTEQILSKLT